MSALRASCSTVSFCLMAPATTEIYTLSLHDALPISHEQNPRTAEEHYQRGVAMMNIGRWDDARESLDKARKAAPKADHIHYALAALDCLTGEADSALANLKVAIHLRPENRYHARNDEAFAFLQEDPRFTELLYPEKDGLAS